MYWKGWAEKDETAAVGAELLPIASPVAGGAAGALLELPPNPNPDPRVFETGATAADDAPNERDPSVVEPEGVPVAVAGLAPKVNIDTFSSHPSFSIL
jgi:hypothetical protein